MNFNLSKARGITLDLGFSSFCLDNSVRITLVDCPGHGSLSRSTQYYTILYIVYYSSLVYSFNQSSLVLSRVKDKDCDWRIIYNRHDDISN